MGWRPCDHKSGQASTREPADTELQGVSSLDLCLVNGKRVDFHMFDLAGSIGADTMLVDVYLLFMYCFFLLCIYF